MTQKRRVAKEESRAKYFLSLDRPRSGFVLITPLNRSGLRIQAGSRTSVPRLARLSKAEINVR